MGLPAEGWDIPALLAFALPALVLLTLIGLLALRPKRLSSVQKAEEQPRSEPLGIMSKAPEPKAAPPEPVGLAPEPVIARVITETTMAEETLRTGADGGEQQLSLARQHLNTGANAEAGEALRSCIRLAQKAGRADIQASARLELGELARSDGDLTTACEHWQIARGLFLDLKQTKEHASVETRMRQNGCPTDWVLNDF